jgi:hypothetical protein
MGIMPFVKKKIFKLNSILLITYIIYIIFFIIIFFINKKYFKIFFINKKYNNFNFKLKQKKNENIFNKLKYVNKKKIFIYQKFLFNKINLMKIFLLNKNF